MNYIHILHHISSKWKYSNTTFHLKLSMSLLNNKSLCSKKKVQDVTWKVPLYMLSIWLSCRFSTWRCFRGWNELSGMERILLLLRSKCCILVSGCRASNGMLVTEEAKPWDNLSITNDCPICEINIKPMCINYSSSMVALQPGVGLGLLYNTPPGLSIPCSVSPFVYPHLSQVHGHVIQPSHFWSSSSSCCKCV